ncbi:MAG: major facilitator superfamily 1 [Nocardioidaceae bacterium]|nr:major facilitator superfamily 1 [Nocardioidaceae bacterium]
MSAPVTSPARGQAGDGGDSPITTLRTTPDLPLVDSEARKRRRATIGLFLVLGAQLMLVLDASVVNVGLPRIAADLHFDPASLSWVLNIYALAFGGLLVLGGRLGDAFGRLRAFEVGLVVFTLASALGGLAPTAGLLLAARALQGVGAALAAPSTLALLTSNAPDEPSRLRALGLFGAVSSAGLSVGLILGGVLTDVGSWRWSLFINVPVGIAVVTLTRRFVTETVRRPVRFDVLGAIAATGGAVSIVWSLLGAPEHGWGSGRTLGGLAAGAVLLVALALIERRVSSPLLPPALLRHRPRVGALLAMALVVGAQFSSFYLLVQFLEGVLDLGPLATGAAFLPLTGMIFVMSRITPRLVPRIGAPRMLMIGTALAVLSFLWMSRLDGSSTYPVALLAPLVLNGIGMGMVFMPITATVLGGVSPEDAGSASGLLQTTQQLGAAVGSAVIVSVFADHAGGTLVSGLHPAFMVATTFALGAFAIGGALVLSERRARRRTSELVAAA